MELCISGGELRKALAAIEAAEKNGFMHCLAVVKLASAGPMLEDCQVVYGSLIERAHPSDGALNWGRFQGVTRSNRFVDGKLVPIDSPEERDGRH
jgi:hypothetical protein